MAYDPNDPSQDPTLGGMPNANMPKTPAQTGPMAPSWWDQNLVQGYYQKYLGRKGSDSELQSHFGNPGGLSGVEQTISGSPEAAAYAKAQKDASTAPPSTKPETPEPQNPYSPSVGSAVDRVINPQYQGDPQLNSLIEVLLGQSIDANNRAKATADKIQGFDDSVRNHLLSQLTEAEKPVDESDPSIAYQLQTADADAQRSLQQEREAMAASGAAGFGPSTGARDAATQSGLESLGRARASNRAGLMANELNSRRSMIQNILGTGSGVLNADDAGRISRDLGTMGGAITALNNRASNANASRGLDISALGTLGGLNNQFMGINNQNNQFYDQMAYTGAHDAAILNYLYNTLAGA